MDNRPFKKLSDLLGPTGLRYLHRFSSRSMMNDYQAQHQHNENIKNLKTLFIKLVKLVNRTNPEAKPGHLYGAGALEGQLGGALDLHINFLTVLKNKDAKMVKITKSEDPEMDDLENNEFNQCDRPEEVRFSFKTLGLVDEMERPENEEERNKRIKKVEKATKACDKIIPKLAPELVDYVVMFTKMMHMTNTKIRPLDVIDVLNQGFVEFYVK